jgi:hypothetical protein
VTFFPVEKALFTAETPRALRKTTKLAVDESHPKRRTNRDV